MFLRKIKSFVVSHVEHLVFLLFACQQMHQPRHKHHDDLRDENKFDKEQTIEQTLWFHGERQAVHVIESHRRNSQR